MTIDTGARGLGFTQAPTGVQLIDVRCGRCGACGAQRDYWCWEPRADGDVLAEVTGVQDASLVRRWASALAALSVARHEPAAALLVLADVDASMTTEIVAPWATGPVVVGADVRDPEMRRRLATVSPTGRAPMVLAVDDLRTAVRAVERGGQVCGPDGGVSLPSVTELVQRDVTMVSARGIETLRARSSWEGLAAGLAALLGAQALSQATS
jgi:hypothetical protein